MSSSIEYYLEVDSMEVKLSWVYRLKNLLIMQFFLRDVLGGLQIYLRP